MIYLSIVTFNRAEILDRTLDAIIATTRQEAETVGVRLLVTDNASSDSTSEMLRAREAAGQLTAYILKVNGGTAFGRNAHWAECLGHDSVRLDDKCLPLASGWLTALKRASDQHHALVAVPYDPTVLHLWNVAPCVPYVRWDSESGRGGPCIFIPGEVTTALGGVDELHPEIVYGWDDVLQIERAELLGWEFGFSLRVPMEFLARADPTRRNSAMQWRDLYLERRRQYQAAERDIHIPIEQTEGWRLGQEARRESR